MELKTIKDINNLSGKKVFLRAEFNVPIDKNCQVSDATRIIEALPTIKFLIESGAKIIICAHLGRPKGKREPSMSLKPVKIKLEELLGKEIKFAEEIIGESVKQIANELGNGDILLLENIRFLEGEEKNDEMLAKGLAELAEIYVSDAFGAVHRKHASTYGVGKLLDSYAGFLIEKEVNSLSLIFNNPQRPITAIIGGSKMETKIGVMNKLLEIVDNIIVGGGIANTLLKAKGINIGSSLYEEEEMLTATNVLQKGGTKILLPIDSIVSEEVSDTAITREIDLSNNSIRDVEKILDIGSKSIENYSQVINKSKTIICNGPVGVYESKPFENGTRELLKAISENKCNSILGGGDTVDAIHKFGLDEKNFFHISTGGGASLEFLEGKILPGIEILLKK